MNKVMRRWAVGGVAAGMLVMAPAAVAWACLSLAGITTNTATIEQGGTLQVHGIEFYGKSPVVLHLDAIDGPVLASVTPSSENGGFDQAVTLPSNVSAGQHVLVATEDAATVDGKNQGSSTGVPARAVINVSAPGGAPLSSAGGAGPKPINLTSTSGSNTGSLVLIGLAAAGASLLLAGGYSVVASRRRSEAEAAKA